eukprot:CAMPEP_0202350940 /NCGR_PEP_ID=MMETSP1126-20121109/7800_1 /ASSEMBLY_ACC=CAM_ASM_000457 /TAXON_ID=3047 /ORGANISM="Dunaliella tertiolecta, Strain CCMP1320" /LENGTH=267 /DNA_ID=CAMNT_0048942989 /DNA_START=46 /DNA_END=849 /DNA_ORIENTATION=-
MSDTNCEAGLKRARPSSSYDEEEDESEQLCLPGSSEHGKSPDDAILSGGVYRGTQIPVNGWFAALQFLSGVDRALHDNGSAVCEHRKSSNPAVRGSSLLQAVEVGLVQQQHKERKARAQKGSLLFLSSHQAMPGAPSALPPAADEQPFEVLIPPHVRSSCCCSSQQVSAHCAKPGNSNPPEQQGTAGSQELFLQKGCELTRKPSTSGSSFCPSQSCASSFCPGVEISSAAGARCGGAPPASSSSVSLEQQDMAPQQQAVRRVKQRLC